MVSSLWDTIEAQDLPIAWGLQPLRCRLGPFLTAPVLWKKLRDLAEYYRSVIEAASRLSPCKAFVAVRQKPSRSWPWKKLRLWRKQGKWRKLGLGDRALTSTSPMRSMSAILALFISRNSERLFLPLCCEKLRRVAGSSHGGKRSLILQEVLLASMVKPMPNPARKRSKHKCSCCGKGRRIENCSMPGAMKVASQGQAASEAAAVSREAQE